jgi:hypothetical protein
LGKHVKGAARSMLHRVHCRRRANSSPDSAKLQELGWRTGQNVIPKLAISQWWRTTLQNKGINGMEVAHRHGRGQGILLHQEIEIGMQVAELRDDYQVIGCKEISNAGK